MYMWTFSSDEKAKGFTNPAILGLGHATLLLMIKTLTASSFAPRCLHHHA